MLQKDILKKDTIDTSNLNCDTWLLPEVTSNHLVQSKERSKVKKKPAAELETDKQNHEEENTLATEASTAQHASKSEVNDSRSPDQPVGIDSGESFSDIPELESLEDLVPERLVDFNEPLTLNRLRHKIEHIQKQAWQQAYHAAQQSGYQDGRAEAESEVQVLSSNIEQLAAQLNNLLSEQQEMLQSAILSMVLTIVERLTHLTIEQNPEVLGNLLADALDVYPANADKPTVSISQGDFDRLEKNNLLSDACHWHIDNSLAGGGFHVKGKYTEIDHSYETRLQQIIDQYFAVK